MSEHTHTLTQTDHRSVKTDRPYIQVLISPKFKAFLEDTIKQIGYATISEFVREAIRRRLEELGFNTDEVLLSGVEKPIG